VASLHYPRSILELGRVFADEETCLRYLFQVRWPDSFVCPHCGGKKGYPIASRAAVKCAVCNKQVYLKVGTIMEKSKTSLCNWFAGAYLMATFTPGISAVQFQRQVNIPSYKCAFQILHKLRAAAGQRELVLLQSEMDSRPPWQGNCYHAGTASSAQARDEARAAARASARFALASSSFRSRSAKISGSRPSSLVLGVTYPIAE